MSTSASSQSVSFAEEAQQAVRQLRGALSSVIEHLPGTPIERASQLADTLDLDNRLAWKISKIVQSRDPFLASQFLPGQAGLRIFLRAAAKKNVEKEVTTRAKAAFDTFRQVMKAHAGDRSSFDAMLAGHVTEDSEKVDLPHRKAAFRHLSYVWGIQARTHLHAYLVNAPGNKDTIDVAAIRGFVDLRWIRPNVPWRISRFYTVDDSGDLHTDFERTPLSPWPADSGDPPDLPLIHEFSSKPLPSLRRVVGARGDVSYHLVQGSVGNTGQLTCFLGEIIRNAEPRYADETHAQLVFVALPRTPCQTFLFDIIIHKDVFGRLDLKANLFGDLFGQASQDLPAECDRLPLHEKVEYLGSGTDAVRTPEVPRYAEMLTHALHQTDWPEDAFQVYRLRLPYPTIPTVIRLSHDLPQPPGSARGE